MTSEQSHQIYSHEARFFRETRNLFFLTKLIAFTWVSFLHLDDINVLLLDVHVVIINSDSTAKLQSWEASKLIFVIIECANLTVSQDDQAVVLIVLISLESINDEL